jgi:hypothetical protein
MRLVVSNYQRDEQNSLDCQFCEEEDQDEHVTVLTFYSEESGQVLVVCPEHLDEMVSVALERHRDGLSRNEPYWYLDADEDPWEGLYE